MNIEDARNFALSFKGATEELFAENWIVFRIGGKWFMLMRLDVTDPRISVKLPPEKSIMLREENNGVRPAYHMNKTHWNDLYLDLLSDSLVKECIAESYHLVLSRLPKKTRTMYE